ncbi:hypothetical protein J2S14_000164 [Lederbergia wuyishanensis]|uniref:Uncharacterized protein n=1 Tax=Lederbergia wuyishanensis TaxID=1347903 RepID=A0ABU0CYY9_9BACI|nr:hypothetical protein [Lederbergia wuyishanensis]
MVMKRVGPYDALSANKYIKITFHVERHIDIIPIVTGEWN